MALSKIDTLQILFTAYVPLAALLHWGVPEPILQFYLAHPWELFFGTFTLPILALAYTGPRSKIRLAVPFVIAVAYCCYRATALRWMFGVQNPSFYDGRHVVLFLTAVDVLVQRRLYLDRFGKERSLVLDREQGVKDTGTWNEDFGKGPQVESWTAVKWAAHCFFSERDIGTRREAKNIPSFPRGQVPSRAKFLFYRGCAIGGAVAFLNLLFSLPRPSPDKFAPHKSKPLLSRRDMTMENLLVRILSTTFWWVFLRVLLGVFYNVASFVGVATCLTNPRDWPPYFGSPAQAYTLRKFWAVFWHGGLRNSFLGPANFFTFDVLRLRRGTLAARYVNIFLVFAASAAFHISTESTVGVPAKENLAGAFFLSQAGGIMIEDFVEWVYGVVRRRRRGQSGHGDDEKTGRDGSRESLETWQKTIGYLWVISWFLTVTPMWSYQRMRLDTHKMFTSGSADGTA